MILGESLLLAFSSLSLCLTSGAAWSSSTFSQGKQQILAQLTPPAPNGGCQIRSSGFNWVENCYQGVQWQKVPNSRSFTGGNDEGYAWIGADTISRKGNAINFDFYQGMYIRYSTNCKTKVYAIVKATDSYVDPNTYHSANETIGKAINFACSVSRGK